MIVIENLGEKDNQRVRKNRPPEELGEHGKIKWKLKKIMIITDY